jgi:hypothetical protein
MTQDRFGFFFWLRWIVGFAGALILSAVFWTFALSRLLGPIQGVERSMTWTVAVFGSWFILLIPFMRKKEQIWKRLNQDEEQAVDAWLLAMGIFIGLLVSSMAVWSYVYRERIGTPGVSWNRDWVKAVMTTWLVFLLPFLAWMYRRADEIFRHAMERQQARGPKFRTMHVTQAKRKLPVSLAQKLETMAPTLGRAHLLTAGLKDGRRIPHIFVMNGSEILGVYDRETFDFEAADIETIELMDPAALPAYDESKWLRLDGGV